MSQKLYNTIFFGTPDFAVPVLETLINLPYLKVQAVFTQPDKPVGRKQALTPPPVKVFAEKNGLAIHQPKKLKTEQFEQQLKQLNPEVIIVVAYGKIIQEKLLALPKYGWLNVHASLLPKYRGASPIQATILAGDKQTGVTLMQIEAGLDTGPIIAQKSVDLLPTDDFASLHDKLAKLGAELIIETLPDYLQGKLEPQAQNNTLATETKIINKEDGRIDWTKTAEYIERHVRAYNPWPSSFCYWNDKRLKIIEAATSSDNSNLSPGQIKLNNNAIIVGCDQGNLELKKIQLEGKKPQSMNDFIKGYHEFEQTKLN